MTSAPGQITAAALRIGARRLRRRVARPAGITVSLLVRRSASAAADDDDLEGRAGRVASRSAPGSAAACPGPCSSLLYAAAAALVSWLSQRVRVVAGHRHHRLDRAGARVDARPPRPSWRRARLLRQLLVGGLLRLAWRWSARTLPPPASVAGEHVADPVARTACRWCRPGTRSRSRSMPAAARLTGL